IGLMWSTANAMAKYNVTANTIMPSGATRMIDSTPRGQKVFEETGKWPSQQAIGTERDPDNVAPLVVYLASDAAAQVNGQVFHSFGYGYTLWAPPHDEARGRSSPSCSSASRAPPPPAPTRPGGGPRGPSRGSLPPPPPEGAL